MAQPKNPQRFAEIEYCMTRYFNCNILPIMKSEKDALNHAQAKEIADYSRSFAGMMRSFANAVHDMPDDTLLYLRATGKECSKTAEDYVASCKTGVSKDNGIQDDLQSIAADWRAAVIGEIGRERYDELSQKLGADLALAYIDNRIEQMMVDRMVKEQMPKSSFEYVLRKGVSNSLFGLAYEVRKSPLETEIEAQGETAYNPSKLEKATAKGVSIASDTLAMGGVYSWASLARVAGTEVVFAGLESALGKEAPKGITVEEVVSQAIFGGNDNQFAKFRRKSVEIKEYENDYLRTVNNGFSKKMNLLKEKPFWETDNAFNYFSKDRQPNPFFPTTGQFSWNNYLTQVLPPEKRTSSKQERQQEQREWNPAIPLVIAPGQEQAYLDFKKDLDQKKQEQQSNQVTVASATGSQQNESNNTFNQDDTMEDTVPDNTQSTTQAETTDDSNQNSWAGLLQSFGLDGLSDVKRNLPYVIAMLPDMLVGLLTGKTQSIGLKKDMVPIASILIGMFVNNPLLKMVLIGMGGANLFNKIGHETIERENGPAQRQYMQYADEELNPRIVNPVLRGNVMVATIDGVPCSVTIPDNAADAVATGALPLNTLANAILTRHDSSQRNDQDNYRNIEMETTIQRDRGMGLR